MECVDPAGLKHYNFIIFRPLIFPGVALQSYYDGTKGYFKSAFLTPFFVTAVFIINYLTLHE